MKNQSLKVKDRIIKMPTIVNYSEFNLEEIKVENIRRKLACGITTAEFI